MFEAESSLGSNLKSAHIVVCNLSMKVEIEFKTGAILGAFIG
jgi:hypothetical protein